MHNSNESGLKTPALLQTQKGSFFLSPISLAADHGIDTPNKIPAAPHPSPINMDIENSNPESKEIFRVQLLKACKLKIPEVIDSFEDGFQKLSYTEEDVVLSPQLMQILSDQCKNGLSGSVDASPGDDLECFDVDHELKQRQCSEITDDSDRNLDSVCNATVCNGQDAAEDMSIDLLTESNDIFTDGLDNCKMNPNELSQITYSTKTKKEHLGSSNSSDLPTYPVFDSIPKIELLESIQTEREKERSVFYDATTDQLDISKLLDSSCGTSWKGLASYRSRSPCSDRLSTIAHCASDASDISDMDFGIERSTDFGMERSAEFEAERSSIFNAAIMSTDFDITRSANFESDTSTDFSVGSSNDFASKSSDFAIRRSANLGIVSASCLNIARSADFDKPKDLKAKKQSSKSSSVRRFLNWRRCLKVKKRAASLDEGKFPFLANRFDSYKTEFEISI